jgi:hypothetical protein
MSTEQASPSTPSPTTEQQPTTAPPTTNAEISNTDNDTSERDTPYYPGQQSSNRLYQQSNSYNHSFENSYDPDEIDDIEQSVESQDYITPNNVLLGVHRTRSNKKYPEPGEGSSATGPFPPEYNKAYLTNDIHITPQFEKEKERYL